MSTKIVVTMENAVAEGRKQVEEEFEKLRKSADATDKQIIAGGRKVRSVLTEENKNAVRDKKAADREEADSANRLRDELIKGNKEADAARAKFDKLATEGQKQRTAEAKKTLSLITKAERNAAKQRAADEKQAIKEIEAEERAAGERRIARQKSIRERMRANSKKFDQENAAAIKAEESRRARGVSRREEISAGFKNARNAGAADRLSEIRGSELSAVKQRGADRQAEIRASLDVANATREEAKQSAALVRQTQESIKTTKAGLRTTRERIRDLQEMKLAGLDVDAQLSASVRLEENQITTLDRLGAELDQYSGRLGTARAKLSDLVDGLSDAERASPGGRRLAKALEDVGVATDRIDAKGLKADADQMQDEFKQTEKTASDAAKEIRELQRTLSGQIANVSGLNSQSGQLTNQISEVRSLKENLEALPAPTKKQTESLKQLTGRLKVLEEELEDVNREMREQQGVARQYQADAEAALRSAKAHGVLDSEIRNLNQNQRLLQNRLRQGDLAIEGNRARETAVKYGLFRRSILGVGDGLKRNKKVLIDAAQAWLLNTRASNEFFNSVQRGDKGGAGFASFGAIGVIGTATAAAGAFIATRKALEELADSGDEAAKGRLKELNYTLESTVATLKAYGAETVAGSAKSSALGTVIEHLAKAAELAQNTFRDTFAADQLGIGVFSRSLRTVEEEVTALAFAFSNLFGENVFTEFTRDVVLQLERTGAQQDKLINKQVRLNLIKSNTAQIEKRVRDVAQAGREEELKQNVARIKSLDEIASRMRSLRGELSRTTDSERVREIEVELVALAERQGEIHRSAGAERLANVQKIRDIEKEIQGTFRRQAELPRTSPQSVGTRTQLSSLERQANEADALRETTRAAELRARQVEILRDSEQAIVNEINAQRQALHDIGPQEERRQQRLKEATEELEKQRKLIADGSGSRQGDEAAERRRLDALREEGESLNLILDKVRETQRARAEGRNQDAALFEAVGRRREEAHIAKYGRVRSGDEIDADYAAQQTRVQDAALGTNTQAVQREAELLSEINALEQEGLQNSSEAIDKRKEEIDVLRSQYEEVRDQRRKIEQDEKDASNKRVLNIELEKRKTLELLNLQSQTPQQKFNAISQLDDIDRERNLLSNGGSKLSQNRLDSKFGEQLKKETEKAADNVERIAKEMQELERKGKAGTEEMERLRKEMERAVEAAKILNAEKAKFDTGSIAKVQNQQVQSFSERVAAIENYLSRQTEQTGQNLTGQLRGRIDDNTVNREIRSRRDADFQSKLGDVQKELEEKGIATKRDRNGNLIATDRSNQRQVRNAVNAARKDVYGKPVTSEERETVRNELAQRLVDTLQESGQINKETAEALRKGLETQTELIASEVALTQSVKELTAALNGKGKAPGEKKSKDVLTPEVAKIKGEQAEALSPKNPEGYTKKGPVLFADDLAPKFDGDVEGPRPDAQPGFLNRLDDKPQPPGGEPDTTDALSGFQSLSGAMGGNAQAVGGLLSAISQGLPQIAQAVVQQSVAVTNNAAMIGQIVEWMNSNMARSADPGKSAAGRGRG